MLEHCFELYGECASKISLLSLGCGNVLYCCNGMLFVMAVFISVYQCCMKVPLSSSVALSGIVGSLILSFNSIINWSRLACLRSCLGVIVVVIGFVYMVNIIGR